MGKCLSNCFRSLEQTVEIPRPSEKSEKCDGVLSLPMVPYGGTIRKVLILRKSTRWSWEKELNASLSDEELKQYLSSRGENTFELLSNEKKQSDFVKKLVDDFRDLGVTAQVVTRSQLKELLPGADLVISAGGDGTYLTAASAITDDTPIIGINSDPVGSEGHLCVGGKNPPPDLLENVVLRNVKWKTRCRIRVTIESPESAPIVALALNEAFIAEQDASTMSTYQISIDGLPMNKQKSSGVLIATGTGSTAWLRTMCSIDSDDVSRVVNALNTQGANLVIDDVVARHTASLVNDTIPFSPDDPRFVFFIREGVCNSTFHVDNVKSQASFIEMKSQMRQGKIVVDGNNIYEFGRGSKATFEMDPDSGLKTLF